VLNLHSTMNPCNAGIQPLVDCAVAVNWTRASGPSEAGS
jgi:hypothetical protein